MKRFSIFLLFLIVGCALNAQDDYRNYVLSRTMLNGTGTSYLDNITYYDGLGRPFQTVEKAVQSGLPVNKNLATLQEYDAAGREWNSWLPVFAGSSDYLAPASIKSSAPGNYDNDSRPYSQPVYKASPLNRLTAQYGPGAAWYNAERPVKTEYLLNTNASPLKCIKYGVSSTGGLTGNSTTFYTSGELSVVKTTDEDLNVSYSFTDKQGRTVLTRQMNNSEEHDTYYIYNDKGNLCFVLQPKYQESADLGKYAFQYEYDARGRCTKKKLPGADFVEYTYNDADQLVYSQDGNQRAQATKKWTYYLYDKFGRLTEQGECTNKGATSSPVVYIHNYYDGYGFINGTGFTDSNYKLTEAQKAYGKGYQTGSVISIFGDSKKIYLMYQYDIQGRVVKTVQNNLLDGLDVTETTYTFSSNPQTVVHKNTYKENGTQKSITETYTYTYDYADRISKVEHTLNNTKVVLSENTYNKLGQLVNRSLHGASADIMGYAYNIRSWLTRIESPNLILKLNYGYSAGGGNIASMFWKSGEEGRQKYTFTYDGLGRMLNADHLILGQQDEDDDDWGVTTGLMSIQTGRQIEETPLARENAFTERVTEYDKNGNILKLVRYGQTGANSYGVIDNLTMTLTGNRLNRVDDASTASAYGGGFEFKDAVKQDNEYAYDANGNLTQDLNKGIEDIQYNCLNLPRLVKFKDQSTITYTYAADGTKLRVEHKIGNSTTRTTYCSNVIYEDGTAKCLLTEEGYVSLDDREYHYYLKDHQGNNRVLVNKNGGVEEINHYYPFGGVFASEENVQPYKYNGKELDTKKGLNWYDYGARQYDAALGIFTTVDPSSEKYYPTSPYVYCGGNPINRIDPTGADWYKDSDGNYHWAERGGDIAEGWTWVGSSVSIEISKSKYVNYYENGGIVANKPVNAFDLIASSPKLQNLFLGENSLLSEASKSRLFNGLVSRGTDAIARPIGEFLVWSGAGELGGPLVGKAIGWILRKMMAKVSPLLRPLGLGNTGRSISRNLTEKLAMQEILANPAAGEIIERMKPINDPRWFGWRKMQYIHTGLDGSKTVIHYVGKWEEGVLKAVDDFKFK